MTKFGISDFEQLEFKIAKRKAIEVLAFFDCKKAIPIIGNKICDFRNKIFSGYLFSFRIKLLINITAERPAK